MANSAKRRKAKHMALREASKVLRTLNSGHDGIEFSILSNPYISEDEKPLFREEMDLIAWRLEQRADDQFQRNQEIYRANSPCRSRGTSSR